jgi:transketolase
VGIGEGTDYSHNGITHYALEDVALMRAQPGLTVVSPACCGQVAPMLRAVQQVPGPAYIRLSKLSYSVPGINDEFGIGHAQTIGHGTDVAIVALGAMTSSAVACAGLLADSGVRATVVAVTSVAPPPVEDLVAALSPTRLALSVEAHYVTGGLGSLVAEVIAEGGLNCRLLRAGAQTAPVGVSGSLAYTHDHLGISPRRLASRVLEALQARRGVAVA